MGRPKHIKSVELPVPEHYGEGMKRHVFELYCEQKIVNLGRLAIRTNVPIATINEWKEADSWVERRARYYSDQLTVLYQKVQRPEKSAQKQVQLAKRVTDLITDWFQLYGKHPERVVPVEVKQLTEAMSNVQKYETEAYRRLRVSARECRE